MLDTLSIADFEPYLETEFAIRFTQDVTLPSKLIEARILNTFSDLERKPFSLIFRTQQKDQYYNQAVFGLQHPEKGEILMFMVPLGLDSEGMRYEAIFS
ncbi:MAG: hypothetical protein NW218_22875 [Saprospiraceae bacterium]|nr:hypothetical protein [Saprospiraceae bacterium]